MSDNPENLDALAEVTAPLKDIPFYATMVDVLIDRCRTLLAAAYDGTMDAEIVNGITDITNRIVRVSEWLAAAQALATATTRDKAER